MVNVATTQGLAMAPYPYADMLSSMELRFTTFDLVRSVIDKDEDFTRQQRGELIVWANQVFLQRLAAGEELIEEPWAVASA